MAKAAIGAKAINRATINSDDKWRVESDLSTLVAAAEIRKDPERMKKCQALAAEKADELTMIKMVGKADGDEDE